MAPLEGVPVNPVDCHPQEGSIVGGPAVGSSGHALLVEEQIDHLSPPLSISLSMSLPTVLLEVGGNSGLTR